METADINVWVGSDTTSFSFPFATSDVHTSVESWTIQRRLLGETGWTDVAIGSGGGPRNPSIIGSNGERADYRVVAVDKQGNRRVGAMRCVYVPIDQVASGFLGSYPGSTPVEQFVGTCAGTIRFDVQTGSGFGIDAAVA